MAKPKTKTHRVELRALPAAAFKLMKSKCEESTRFGRPMAYAEYVALLIYRDHGLDDDGVTPLSRKRPKSDGADAAADYLQRASA